ncbi:hypothetical protein PN4B1_08300 [Paenibacillus naphthalenovorans]|uniref:Uncharacterized protein n=1 Tax=Paenibacillus naphthalenovorans TaxID=162209 RepID=A0A0U2MU56_9BACL|nr:hypothetical protein IJ22_05080 [Paenibacillus naphthalenovorans]GCL70926.1 hypothetical protein PN4B1_08300 [Paenibacillus naphthalenovorans]SDI18560.1 hypothetical protein SAMN05421868_1041 [Paenibacillus naphthalenovorans]
MELIEISRPARPQNGEILFGTPIPPIDKLLLLPLLLAITLSLKSTILLHLRGSVPN